ncbi:MAG TPA: DsbA family protein [Micromonosporaceae bacterium]|nr:DsbA family protein [Micromonosporaceae bacterium]
MTKRGGQKKQSARMVREQMARERRRRRTIWTSVAAAAVLVIAGMIGWGIYASRPGEVIPPPGAVEGDSGIAVGSGPVTIDVYEDFMCPACRQSEELVGSTLDQLAADGKARVVYHPVAILDRYSTTKYSTRASAASGCAAEGGKFREYATALFANQPSQGSVGLSDTKLVELGKSVGLGDDFAACVRVGKYKTWTVHVTDKSGEQNVRGTPTIRVAGKDVDAFKADEIKKAVEAAS